MWLSLSRQRSACRWSRHHATTWTASPCPAAPGARLPSPDTKSQKNFWCTVYHSKSLNILNIIEPKTARIWFNDTPVWIEVPVVDTLCTKHALKCFKFRVPVDSVDLFNHFKEGVLLHQVQAIKERCHWLLTSLVRQTPPVWALKLQCRGTSRSTSFNHQLWKWKAGSDFSKLKNPDFSEHMMLFSFNECLKTSHLKRMAPWWKVVVLISELPKRASDSPCRSAEAEMDDTGTATRKESERCCCAGTKIQVQSTLALWGYTRLHWI